MNCQICGKGARLQVVEVTLSNGALHSYHAYHCPAHGRVAADYGSGIILAMICRLCCRPLEYGNAAKPGPGGHLMVPGWSCPEHGQVAEAWPGRPLRWIDGHIVGQAQPAEGVADDH